MNRTYYVDAERGDDRNAGTDPQFPWRSLARVSDEWFGPGDRVLLTSGQTFRGPMMLSDACRGTEDARIEVSTTGPEPATVMAGKGTGIILDGVAHVTVQNLRLIGAGTQDNDGVGVEARTAQFTIVKNVEVSGFRIAGLRSGGGLGNRFEEIVTHGNGGAGISIIGGRPEMPRSQDVYVGYCRAEGNRGDPKNLTSHSGSGILLAGVDGALVEYCVAAHNGGEMPREGNGPIGIWAWNSDQITIQNCISHNNTSSSGDGGGFDLDGGVTNSTIQYCLSYENDGCGFLLCQYPGARPWHDNILRFNISVNDGARNHQAGIALWAGDSGFGGGQIYNNTIINRENAVNLISDVEGFEFLNNVFYTEHAAVCGDAFRVRFKGNFYRRQDLLGINSKRLPIAKSMEEWVTEQGQESADGSALPPIEPFELRLPDLYDLPTRIEDFARLEVLRSPAVLGGVEIGDRGDRDFFGSSLPSSAFVGAIAPG